MVNMFVTSEKIYSSEEYKELMCGKVLAPDGDYFDPQIYNKILRLTPDHESISSLIKNSSIDVSILPWFMLDDRVGCNFTLLGPYSQEIKLVDIQRHECHSRNNQNNIPDTHVNNTHNFLKELLKPRRAYLDGEVIIPHDSHYRLSLRAELTKQLHVFWNNYAINLGSDIPNYVSHTAEECCLRHIWDHLFLYAEDESNIVYHLSKRAFYHEHATSVTSLEFLSIIFILNEVEKNEGIEISSNKSIFITFGAENAVISKNNVLLIPER